MELGVTGVGEEVAVEDDGRWRGRGECLATQEKPVSADRMSADEEASQPERLEMELRRLVDVQRRRLREVNVNFSPLSNASANTEIKIFNTS